MPLRHSQALRLLHATFRHLPAATRAHILGRYLSCPFLRVLPLLSERGRILDIGAGHGTFARLAVESPGRSVVAVEPDVRKMYAFALHERIQFVCAFDEAIRGSFDAVTMFDVLYRVPREEWSALFARVYTRLRPGGRFIIKELDPDRRLKFAWNRTQELISDRLLHLTLGNQFVYARREEVAAQLEAAGFVGFRATAIDRFYPHSHVVYTAERA